MPTPCAPRIILAPNARMDLHAVARAPSTPHSLALRARIVVRAAEADTPTNTHIGRQLGGAPRPVGTWRRRYHDQGMAGLHAAVRSGRPRTSLSPTRVQVISVASTLPQDQDRPVTRWTLDESVAPVLDDLDSDALRRSSVWRLLHDRDLKPHQSEYWLNSHEAHCEAKAHAMCQLSIQALDSYHQGRVVICCDEKTGRQVLERTAPTKPAQAGRRERRAHEDIRHGPRVLINALAVATGQSAWTIRVTRTTTDGVAHLQQAYASLPRRQRYAWGMENLHTHWSLDVWRLVARWCQVPFRPKQLTTGSQRRTLLCDPSHRHVWHFPPTHGAWLKQAEWFFGVLHRRFWARGSLGSAKACALR